MNSRPLSPHLLAERWGCSEDKVRRMYRAGQIKGFKIGKPIRFSAAAVEQFECQNNANDQNTELPPTADPSPLSSLTPNEDAFGSRLARMSEGSPKLALVTYGSSDTSPPRSA